MTSYRPSSDAVGLIAEMRIRQAMEEGLFDNLPGEGKPLPPMDLEVPGNELVGWVREWIKRERLKDQDLLRMDRG